MKKNIILSAAAILAGCLFISGCDLADEFTAPKDTWVYKESTKSDNSFTYTWGEGENEKSVEFDLYVNYATKDATVKFNGTSAEVKPGLNVILVPTSDTKIETLQSLIEATNIQVALFCNLGEKPSASNSATSKDKTIPFAEIGRAHV